MSPDEFQNAWQADSSRTRVTVDADLLLKEVRRNQQELRATISWGDFSTIGTELVLILVFIVLGITLGSPWTLYLMVPALIWSIGYKLVVRARRKQSLNDPGEPLLSSVKESLALVEHLIWSQRKVFWWSQLPQAIAMLTFFFHVSWQSGIETNYWWGGIVSAASFVFVAMVFSFIYYTNHRVIRTQHEPRRRELVALLDSLGDETTSEVSGEYPMLMRPVCVPSRRRMVGALLCALVLFLIGLGGIFLLAKLDEGYPKKSPFAGVQWQEFEPRVKVGGEWYMLISLDGIPASEIVRFCQETYGDIWQKRFEEDLVEVLTKMGHTPGDAVKLVVLPAGVATPITIDDVPMTRRNRWKIYRLNQLRERREEEGATRDTVSIGDAEAWVGELISRLPGGRSGRGRSDRLS